MDGISKTLLVGAFALVGACGTEGAPSDSQVQQVAVTGGAPAAMARELEAFRGTWNLTALDEAGDSMATSTFVAGPDPNAWTSQFPGREPIRVRVIAAEGDSVVLESDPYESILQPGVRVTAWNTLRAQGDQITGTWFTRRGVTGPDSTMRGTVRGSRAR